jgi:hypothetical protein
MKTTHRKGVKGLKQAFLLCLRRQDALHKEAILLHALLALPV